MKLAGTHVDLEYRRKWAAFPESSELCLGTVTRLSRRLVRRYTDEKQNDMGVFVSRVYRCNLFFPI